MTNSANSSEIQSQSSSNDPYLWPVIGAAVLFASMFAILLGIGVAAGRTTTIVRPVSVSEASKPAVTQTASIDEVRQLMSGKRVFHNACMVCHGPEGDGVPSLGKPLRNSAFVQTQSEDELFQLIVDGRLPTDPANTTGSLMPPRGAVELNDQQVHEVILFLRSIQDPSQPTASLDAWQPIEGASGGGRVAVNLVDHPGYDLFISSCSACHGEGAEGIDQLGLPLTTSGFVLGKSDKDLATFIKMGRASWDPSNTTGIDMPPKGGNPAINDDQLQLIIDYMRAVQKTALGE